jgi:hypothetical protein
VEAGKNTSTVIPASRKRRRKGNPVVSDETIVYACESSALTANCRPVLSSERAPQDEEQSDFPAKQKEKVKSGYRPQRSARHQDILTDDRSVSMSWCRAHSETYDRLLLSV